MEVEVTSFLGSLTANLKKFDIDAHSQTLLTAGGDWIETFQKQLSAVSLLYCLKECCTVD